jgi:membrane protease subunit HflK
MTKRPLAYVVALVLVAAYLLTGVVSVQPGERAVVRRFGRVVAKPGPGLWVGFPAGIDRVDRVPLTLVRRVTVGFVDDEDSDPAAPVGQLLTGDQNLVNAQVLIDYAVRDEEVEDYVAHRDRADGLLARAAEAVLAEWVGGRTVDDVLIEGKSALPGVLTHQVQAMIEPYHLGVQVQGAAVAHLFPPRDVRQAFDEVTRAQAAVLTRELAARQEAARQLRAAEAEKYHTEQLTAAYVREQDVLARAEARSFEKRLEQYQQLRKENPNFLSGLWWDEVTRLFARLNESGRIDLLDNHLSGDGLDLTVFPPLPKRK